MSLVIGRVKTIVSKRRKLRLSALSSFVTFSNVFNFSYAYYEDNPSNDKSQVLFITQAVWKLLRRKHACIIEQPLHPHPLVHTVTPKPPTQRERERQRDRDSLLT